MFEGIENTVFSNDIPYLHLELEYICIVKISLLILLMCS